MELMAKDAINGKAAEIATRKPSLYSVKYCQSLSYSLHGKSVIMPSGDVAMFEFELTV